MSTSFDSGLEASKQFLDAISDMILIKGENSRIIWANKAFRDYYGMDNEALRGMIDSSINKPDFTQQYIKDDQYVFTTGKTLDIPSEPVTRHDGQVRYFHTIKSAIRQEGNVIMTIGVSRDITEEKKASEQLQEQNKELERMNQLMISRELKMAELKDKIEKLEKQLSSK